MSQNPISQNLASTIDHTLLKPEATVSDIARLCEEAAEWHFASVCVNPFWVPEAAARLGGSDVRVCTVIGFPLGANTTRAKIDEAEIALRDGATELDMVQNVGALRSGMNDVVGEEIRALAVVAQNAGAILKVILETSLLTDEEKRVSCQLAVDAGADFVKTSTGFCGGGATAGDIRLMRQAVGPSIGVKASGGVRTLESAREMLSAGATRIGTSSGVAILRGLAPSGKGGY